ncbi:acyl-CoA dehydrogenase [Streptomyces triticirhizae]|uniref:acyl-CoA dehydrogenase n=1 Tax=Streptomyces triticirhizae TaxID=2483353 RepID=UPI0018F32A91|nr:acyl-CoA dehydrogenase [Streptomyces triticirhizae]
MPEQAVLDRPLAPLGADGRRLWAELGAAGRIGRVYRRGDPAAGVDPERLGELMAALDRTETIGSTLAVCVQIATAVPLLTLSPGPGPVAAALAEAIAGRAVIALAATDEGSGSDLLGLGTRVDIGDDAIEVTGEKRWITNATQADHFLVLGRHRNGRHFTSFSWALVPASAPGVSVRPADTDLFDGSGTGHVSFDGVRLSRAHLVGRPGRGLAAFAAHIAVERLAGALWGVALCRRVLADTRAFLTSRRHAEGTLWELDSLRQRFAGCLLRAHQLQALTRELAERVSHHDTTAAALLKAASGTTVPHVLTECAQLQGAEGFASGGAQRLRTEAALFGVGGGTTEVVLSVVAGAADRLLAELGPQESASPGTTKKPETRGHDDP